MKICHCKGRLILTGSRIENVPVDDSVAIEEDCASRHYAVDSHFISFCFSRG
jgi:hypothetical protein